MTTVRHPEPELGAEAEPVDPAAVPVEPALVDLAPRARDGRRTGRSRAIAASRRPTASTAAAAGAQRRRAASAPSAPSTAPSAAPADAPPEQEGGHRDRIVAVAAPLTERSDAGQHRLTSGRPGRADRRHRGGRAAQPGTSSGHGSSAPPPGYRLGMVGADAGRRPACARAAVAPAPVPAPTASRWSSIASETSEPAPTSSWPRPRPGSCLDEHEIGRSREPRSRATPAEDMTTGTPAGASRRSAAGRSRSRRG